MDYSQIKDVSDLRAAVGPERLLETLRSQTVPFVDENAQRLTDLLAARRYSAQQPPPPERVIYRLGEAAIATPGNLVGFYAQPKAGKTAFMGGVLGSTLGGEGDTFNVTSANLEGWAVIHMDTEQSPQHHHKAITRALQRAGHSEEPPWLYSYRLADVTLPDRRAALRHEVQMRHQQHGGIHSIFLDGIADFIADPNDPEESFGWVDELHRLAIQYDAVIICVLHENPGSETGKTRGHLGSQLERKAETNLRMAKDSEGITVVFSERSRQAHIPRAHGTRFRWCEDAMMHVSCDSASVTKTNERQRDLSAFARQVFAGLPPDGTLTWREVMDRIREVGNLKEAGAEKRLRAMLRIDILKRCERGYYVA